MAEKERVQKLIAAAGLCSRRQAETWISEGRVQVNGQDIKLGDGAYPTDKITVNGAPIPQPKRMYLLVHKPKGYVTTVKDFYGGQTVMDLVPDEERIYPVGRLDKDTTGALLFTNDGEFANQVMHPRYEIQKTYVATLDKSFDKKHIATLAEGVQLDEGIVKAKVRVLGPHRVEVTLHQGFNHVVKRILKALGYWVRELARIQIGSVKLDIPLGAFRPLRPAEIEALLAAKPKPQPRSTRRSTLRRAFGRGPREEASHQAAPQRRDPAARMQRAPLRGRAAPRR